MQLRCGVAGTLRADLMSDEKRRAWRVLGRVVAAPCFPMQFLVLVCSRSYGAVPATPGLKTSRIPSHLRARCRGVAAFCPDHPSSRTQP